MLVLEMRVSGCSTRITAPLSGDSDVRLAVRSKTTIACWVEEDDVDGVPGACRGVAPASMHVDPSAGTRSSMHDH
jgi:hypothetical protein